MKYQVTKTILRYESISVVVDAGSYADAVKAADELLEQVPTAYYEPGDTAAGAAEFVAVVVPEDTPVTDFDTLLGEG